MVLNKNNVLSELSFYTLLLLFPGFFIYHSLVAMGFLPGFLGGYFSPVSLLVLIGYTFLAFFIVDKVAIRTLIPYAFFLLWISVVSVHYFFGDRSANDSALYEWSLIAILVNLVCFLMGSHINLDDEKLKKAILFFFFALVAIVLTHIEMGEFSIARLAESKQLSNYQGFGRSLLIVSLFAFVLSKGLLKHLIFFFAILVLYFNGSRSEFIFFFISSILYYFFDFIINYKKKGGSTLLGVGVILFFGVVSAYFLKNIDFDNLNRTAQVLDASNSSSFIARKELEENALQSISQNWFLGNYGYYMEKFGKGGYVHNGLSVWADFGIIAFVAYILSALYFAVYAWLSLFVVSFEKRKYIALLFLSSVCLLLAMITTKDYSYMFLGLTMGLYFNRKMGNKA